MAETLADFICEHCGVAFQRVAWRKPKPRFCSQPCRGTACKGRPRTETNEQRFWRLVDKTVSCWNWIGTLRPNGYGSFWKDGSTVSPHRYSWEIHHGQIHDGMQVCHICDNRRCVNPAHMFLGTQLDNMRDRLAKGKFARGAEHPMNLRPELRARGEKHGNAKLSDSDVGRLKSMRIQGLTFTELGKVFGVSASQACAIVKGRSRQVA